MGKLLDLSGKRFDRLLVLERNYNSDKKHDVVYNCVCDCGNICEVYGTLLRAGKTSSCGCKKSELMKSKHLNNRYWRYKIGETINNSKINITITDSIYENIKNYIYICNTCGYDAGIISEYEITNKSGGCPCCAGRIAVEGINDIPTVAPWMIPYFQGGYDEAKLYTRGSDRKVIPICPICMKIKDRSMTISNIYTNKSIGCKCGDGISYPHKFVRSAFIQSSIEFNEEYSPEWLNKRRFDFYLPKYRCFIEVDGLLGHGKSVFDRSKLSKEDSLEIDRWKDKQALLYGYKVYRISADKSDMEYMKENILISLNHIIDMKNVDWSLCDKDALKNIVKEVCDYYMEYKPISTTDIGNLYNVSGATIRRYLLKGGKHGWCDYSGEDGNKIRKNNIAKSVRERFNKRVQVYEDNLLIGEYNSVNELSRRSVSDFNVFFNASKISNVANGIRNHHKGYVFKYIS